MEQIILVCKNTLEGIFTGIYEAYRRKLSHTIVCIQTEGQDIQLFAEYISIKPEADKAVKVMRTLRNRFGEEDFRAICYCLATEDKDKAQAVYRTVEWGLRVIKQGQKGVLLDNLADDNVRKVMELNRRTLNEIHHLKGFLRFQELEQGILYAKIGPKNDVLALLTPHFADRLPMENFIIYDDVRELYALHKAGGEWYLVSGERDTGEGEHNREAYGESGIKLPDFSEEEKAYEELFTYFCHKICIIERKNPTLQRNMLPLRFQKYMVEFANK